ncbi:MAG TPA: metalloregulator ArsR/SmtB family transcription factor [Gemmatimonadales bacterium]|jgi:DNA-binding transcriptional ArsR family regulator
MPRTSAAETVFHAIADPTRRELLLRLGRGERSAGDLSSPFKMSQPALSQHLRVLREAGLVRQRRDGRHQIYSLEPGPLREVFDFARFFERFWDRKLDALGKYLDRRVTP